MVNEGQEGEMNRRTALLGAGVAALSVVLPAAADETTDGNKKVAQQYIDEVWGKGNLAALDQFVSPDYASGSANDAPGVAALSARIKSHIQSNAASVTDIVYTVGDLVAEGDKVVARIAITGASRQGKKIDAPFFHELQFASGKIVSSWIAIDTIALNGF